MTTGTETDITEYMSKVAYPSIVRNGAFTQSCELNSAEFVCFLMN